MRLIKIHNIFSAYLFIALFLVTLLGCGSGGSGSGGGGSEFGGSGSDGNDSPPFTDNSVTLSWNKPSSNSDGSALSDLSGYKVYYGASSNNYTQSIDVGNNTSAVISSLSSGTWCFATTAYDSSGNESAYSNEACKTI